MVHGIAIPGRRFRAVTWKGRPSATGLKPGCAVPAGLDSLCFIVPALTCLLVPPLRGWELYSMQSYGILSGFGLGPVSSLWFLIRIPTSRKRGETWGTPAKARFLAPSPHQAKTGLGGDPIRSE